VRLDPRHLPDAARAFLAERHLASLTTSRRDGSAHVVPVGFTFVAMDGTVSPPTGIARVITNDGSMKVRNASPPGARGALCQISGRFWLTLEGYLNVSRDPVEIASAVQLYSQRYRIPRVNPTRVVVTIVVDRIMGNI